MTFPITAYIGKIPEIPPSIYFIPKIPQMLLVNPLLSNYMYNLTIIWSIHPLSSLLGLTKVIWGIKEKTYEVSWKVSLLLLEE